MPSHHRVSRNKRKSSRRSSSRKSVRRSRSKSKKSPISSRHFSMKGLQDWHDHEYRHLGWMVLAKHRGNNDKIKAYKNSVDRLCRAIEKEMEEHKHNSDKLHDLKILHENVMVLHKHVKKDFKH